MSTLNQKYGPWAVVTGASDGIGREISRRLAEGGFHIVVVGRRRALLRALSDELQASSGVEVRVVDADLSTDAGWQLVVSATQSLDVGLFIASAGFGGSGNFVDAELTHELEMLDVNCRALMAMTYHFGRRFVDRQRGGIVLMSSLVAFQGVPKAAHYAATKAYVQT
ncbi:MAG: SDR family NAD(P)-dependent oxidoreductase, partial [Myxococcota bacterium]